MQAKSLLSARTTSNRFALSINTRKKRKPMRKQGLPKSSLSSFCKANLANNCLKNSQLCLIFKQDWTSKSIKFGDTLFKDIAMISKRISYHLEVKFNDIVKKNNNDEFFAK